MRDDEHPHPFRMRRPPRKDSKPAFYGESSIVFCRIRNAYRRVPVDLMVHLPCNWCSAMWLLTLLAFACARLSDSIVGTFLKRAKRKGKATWKRAPARFSHLFWLIDLSPLSWSLEQATLAREKALRGALDITISRPSLCISVSHTLPRFLPESPRLEAW